MSVNSAPYEIVGVPFEVYFAPILTAFPAIDEVPGVGWTLIGTSGALNYSQDGVKVSHPQSVNIFRALGSAAARKTFRTEEDCKVSFMLADVTLENYKLALNNNTVTETLQTTGVSGNKKIGLSRGLSINTIALLVRGRGGSGYGDYNAQYEIPYAQEIGSSEVEWKRDTPAMLALEFLALVDPDATSDDEQLGRLRMQTSDVNS